MDIKLKDTLDSVEISKAIEIINTLEEKAVSEFDLSKITFVKPYGLVLLLQIFDYLDEIRDISWPSQSTLTYMARMGFFSQAQNMLTLEKRIQEINSQVVKDPENQTLIDITKIQDNSDIRKTLEEVHTKTYNIFVKELHYREKDIDDFIVMLSELLNNIPRHSKSFGYICAQRYHYPKSPHKYISVCISDMGIGVRNSYKINGLTDIKDDKEALRYAIIEGVSSKVKGLGRGGNGYKGIKEIVNKLNGVISVKSGTVQLDVGKSQHIYDENIPYFPGTQIEIILPEKNI
ncbi:hypothetical protein [Robertmurraya sp. P23]|uniref:hypothetical protein n=1 Tax=Robertmurraya sp. P23 TaxID=3436931 RepID=UPI003D983432